MQLFIWTDGSCLNNPGSRGSRVGGAAAILQYNDKRIAVTYAQRDTTSQRMEIMSILIALQQIKRSDVKVTLYNDSSVPIDILSGKSFASKNTDLYSKIFEIASTFTNPIKFVWIKKDSHKFNRTCHDLANEVRTDLIQQNELQQLPIKVIRNL